MLSARTLPEGYFSGASSLFGHLPGRFLGINKWLPAAVLDSLKRELNPPEVSHLVVWRGFEFGCGLFSSPLCLPENGRFRLCALPDIAFPHCFFIFDQGSLNPEQRRFDRRPALLLRKCIVVCEQGMQYIDGADLPRVYVSHFVAHLPMSPSRRPFQAKKVSSRGEGVTPKSQPAGSYMFLGPAFSVVQYMPHSRKQFHRVSRSYGIDLQTR